MTSHGRHLTNLRQAMRTEASSPAHVPAGRGRGGGRRRLSHNAAVAAPNRGVLRRVGPAGRRAPTPSSTAASQDISNLDPHSATTIRSPGANGRSTTACSVQRQSAGIEAAARDQGTGSPTRQGGRSNRRQRDLPRRLEGRCRRGQVQLRPLLKKNLGPASMFATVMDAKFGSGRRSAHAEGDVDRTSAPSTRCCPGLRRQPQDRPGSTTSTAI